MGLFGYRSKTDRKFSKLMSDALKEGASSAGKAMAQRKKDKNRKKGLFKF